MTNLIKKCIGTEAFLLKPVAEEELVATIQQVSAQPSLSDELSAGDAAVPAYGRSPQYLRPVGRILIEDIAGGSAR